MSRGPQRLLLREKGMAVTEPRFFCAENNESRAHGNDERIS